MRSIREIGTIRGALLTGLVAAALLTAASGFAADVRVTTKPFKGIKANTGTATFSKASPRTLTLSDDFKVPDTPAPHWQVVDSKGNSYLLQRLVIKGDKYNKTITVPDYVHDIAKVQIWCAFAEVLLGEAPFDAPVM